MSTQAKGVVVLDHGHHGVLTWYARTVELVEAFLVTGRFTDTELCPRPVIE